MNLSDLAIRRPTFITCLVLVMLAVGLVALKTRPVDLFPDVTFPVVTVTTIYPGAGPAEIETLISKPLEDEASTISGLKRLTSQNFEGTSQLICEFRLGTDIKYAEQQVRDRVSIAKAKFPLEVKEPVIRRVDLSDQPILRLALKANLDDAKLYDVADNMIKPRLGQVDDVGLIEIVGGRKREIHVELDRAKLKNRELSVQAVAGQLAAAGENIPSGKVNEGDRETVFRSLGEFHSVDEISRSLVRLYGNEVATKISDLGTVRDTLEDERNRAFVSGEKSLFIDVYRQSGSNTLAVAESTKKIVDKLNKELSEREQGAKLVVVQDGTKKIRDSVDDVQENIFLGVALTILVVYLFLANGRSTIITGLALPNSLLGAFILMAIAGFTVNVVTLLSMSLAIGLLIDDAIVVRENIFRHIELGQDPVKAASQGTEEVRLAVVATTLVVISVFGPVAFMSGIVGQFLRQFGLTVCFAMAISLFDALTVAPMLSAYFAGNLHKGPRNTLWGRTVGRMLGYLDRAQTALEHGYGKLLGYVIRRPLRVLFVSGIVFLVTSSTLAKIPKTFAPPEENGEFSVDLDMPPGTSLDAMNRTAAQVDEIVRRNKEIDHTALTVGGRNGEANQASLYVMMVPSRQRNISTTLMKERIREQLKGMAFSNPKVKDYDPTGGSFLRPFTLNLISTDEAELEKYADLLLQHLKKDTRLKDVDTSYRPGKPELQVRLIPARANAFGITTQNLGAELRAQVEGVTPAKFRANGSEYDIRVRLEPDQRNLREEFPKVWIPNVNQRLIRLADVATPTLTTGPATINRQDRGRYIQLSADLAPGAGLDRVMEDTESFLKNDIKLPSSIRMTYIGNAEDFQDFGRSVIIAFGFAVLFVFLVLASLYESFITPFAIMLALPLALCGAFLALFIAHETISIFAVLGIVMLLGIASKNSILLVDYTNKLIAEGMSRSEALIHAGKVRLRPILMTSMALIAGTLPVALGLNEVSKSRTSMGVAIIGGMISSTLLTLVVVPAAFSYIDRFRIWVEGVFRKMQGRGGSAKREASA